MININVVQEFHFLSKHTNVSFAAEILNDIFDVKSYDISIITVMNVTQKQYDRYTELKNRLQNHEPISKILGKKMFWKYEFITNHYVLDPREDTETVISAALELHHEYGFKKILELGIGSGCISMTILKEIPNTYCLGIDISIDAIQTARTNCVLLGLDQRMMIMKNNWSDNIVSQYDLIVTNPPYIPTNDIKKLDDNVKIYDPHIALDGGIDGLEYYRKNYTKNLTKKGILLLEIGHNQHSDVLAIYKNMRHIKTWNDINDHKRVIALQKS